MSIKDIAVLVDHSLSAHNRVETAARFAEHWQAALIGVYGFTPPERYLYSYSGMPPPDSVIAEFREHERHQQEKAKEMFESTVKDRNIMSSFTAAEGYVAEWFTENVRHADVGVISQPGNYPKEDFPRQLANNILLNAGVPILCIPKSGWNAPIGQRIVVAWNNGRESAIALRSAMPLLEIAESVDIVSGGSSEQEARSEALRCCERLAHHGIDASPHGLHAERHREGERIMEFCEGRNPDLLVMGAWGHTRVSEALMGGATDSVLQIMTIPVLFAH